MKILRPSLLPFVLVLVCLGTSLRAYRLDGKGLWSDELFSTGLTLYHDAFGADQISRFRFAAEHEIEASDTFWTIKAADRSPPLFELLSKVSTRVLGPTETAMRMPSLLASVALLGFLGWLSLCVRDPLEAHVYLLLLAFFSFSRAAIEYAQEARSYSLGLLLSMVLSARLFSRLRAGLKRSDLPRWPEIALFTLACHTHYNLLVLSAVFFALYFSVACSRHDWPAAGRLLTVPLSCVPWLALSAHTSLHVTQGQSGWSDEASLQGWVQSSLLAHNSLFGRNFLLVAFALVIAFLMSRAVSAERPRWFRADLDLVVLFALGVAQLLIVLSIAATTRMFSARYLLFGVPLLLLVVASLAVKTFRWKPALLAIGALFAATQAPLLPGYFAHPNEGYREATRWVLQRLDSRGVVVTTSRPQADYYRFYLEQGAERIPRVIISGTDEAAQVCDQVSGPTTVGIIGHQDYRPLIDALVASCGARFVRDEAEFRHVLAQRWVPR